MKKTRSLLIILALLLPGCSGTGFRPLDLLPDMAKSSNAKRGGEWRGVMVGAVETRADYGGRSCFRVKRSAADPGAVLACTSDPATASTIAAIDFRELVGAAPVAIRFRYEPAGGDQDRAIGPALRQEIELLVSDLRKRAGKELSECRESVKGIGEMLINLRSDVNSLKPPDHHHQLERIDGGIAVVNEFESKWPEQGRPCADIADDLENVLKAAGPTGYLEIIPGTFGADQ
jgi:hypothetical protein